MSPTDERYPGKRAPSAAIGQAYNLLHSLRWAALGTLQDHRPYVSMVAYAPMPDHSCILHLSRLAVHTRYLHTNQNISLCISESDQHNGDPHTLSRLTLTGTAHPLTSGSDEYRMARDRYLTHLPDTCHLFELGDFTLFRVVPDTLRFIGGFGQAFSLSTSELDAAGKVSQA